MRKIVDVKALDGYCLKLHFDDGVSGTVDLSHLAGKGVFAVWNDESVFRSVAIGERGDLVWSDKVDLCPDALYLEVTGKKPSDLFPLLNEEDVHA